MQENNPVPTPVMPTVDSPQITAMQAVDQKPSTNNFLVILLSILLLLSVTIAGFFAYQTQKLVKELTILKTEEKVVAVATTEPTAEPVATSSASATPDPTANWKTYVHQQLGFNIKYPQKWTIRQDPKFVVFDTNIISNENFMDSEKKTNYNFQVSIDPKTNFDEWTKYESTKKLQDQKIGSDVFEKYIVADLYFSLNYILNQNGKIFRFSIFPYDVNTFPKELASEIDHVLSTFKFTN